MCTENCFFHFKTITSNNVFGNAVMSRSRVYEWHKRFLEGRNEVEYEKCVGRPCSSKTDDHISIINDSI
jgi:hypothetical protein